MSRPPYHPRINSHAHVHSASSSNLDSNDKVASASTALERVFGLLDGFEDDMDCPLCLEEMDISDLNFKPCPCGYQICRFCWHHIKENLNGLCPACRAPYDDETVEFKAIKPDELKRLQAAKKIRDKRRKDDALTVKNMANIRVRQRAQVHVQGMTTKIANEDTLNQLKGTEQFGQYGKVVKLFMSKRSSTVTQPASTHPHYQPVNVYVNYRTAAEASNCIAAIDGSTTGDGHKLKAIWGTTRYCPTYLKGGKCNNENCMQAHEPGEEIEGAGPTSREEMLTYVAMGESDTQRSKASNAVSQIRKQQEAATLPPTASWATKNAMNSLPVTPIVINSSLPPLSATIKPPLVPRPIPVSKPQTHPLPARPATRLKPEAAAAARVARAPSPTPVSPVSPPAELPVPVAPAAIPVVDTPSPVASSSQPSSPPPPSLFSDLDSMEPVFANGAAFASHARSIARPPSVPFPELDFGGGAFSFSLNLDVKGKGRAVPLAGEDARSTRDFANLDGFGRESSPPSVAMASNASSNSQALSYLGSFDPFSDTSHYENGTDPHSGTSSPPPSADELSRRSSRFGFARRGSVSTKGSDLTSALARNAFAGRESPAMPMGSTPFAPPGLSQSRPSSSGFNPFATASSASGDPREGRPGGAMETSSLWSTGNLAPTGYASSALPPALLRTFVSPAQSVTTSPQLSPRPRIGSGYNPSNGAGNGAGASLPPGIALNQNSRAPLASFPLPAASFPLPPPAPRAPGGSSGGPGGGLGKDDLFALIAAAQASAPKTQAATPESYPFNDPAILNARLASAPHYASPMNTGPPPLSGYHALEHLSRGGFGPEQQQHLQQQQLQQQQLQLQQQQLQQQAQQQQLQQQAQQQQQQQAYQNQILLQQQQQHLQQQQQQHPAYYGPPGVQRQPMMNSGFRR